MVSLGVGEVTVVRGGSGGESAPYYVRLARVVDPGLDDGLLAYYGALTDPIREEEHMHAHITLTPTPIEVCTDCLIVLAHGVESDAEGETWERLSARWPGEDPVTTPAVTLGSRDEDAPEDPYFSWSPCDGCGSTLGGDRQHATGWTPLEADR